MLDIGLQLELLQPVSRIVELGATERLARESNGPCYILISRHLGQDSTETIKRCISGMDERPIKV